MEGEHKESFSLPTPEVNLHPIVRSPHFDSVIGEVREKSPEIRDEVQHILESIDRQGLENLALVDIEEFNGLRIPITRINVNSVVGENYPSLKGGAEDDPQKAKKEVFFIFRGFAPSPAGHPFTSWPTIYDRVISSMPKIAHAVKAGEQPPEIDIYSLGSPIGLGGKVSKDWPASVRRIGYAAHGKAYAGLIKGLVDGNKDDSAHTRITFNGVSAGATVAEQTFRRLSPEGYKINLLLDNPVNTENYPNPVRRLRGVQQAAMYLGEYLVRGGFNRRAKMEAEGAKRFNSAYQKVLEEKFGEKADDDAQKRLKLWAVGWEEWSLVKGTPLSTESRAFVRRGYKDPLSFKPWDLLKGLRKSKGLTSYGQIGKVSNFAINQTHFIERVRVDQWKRAITYCKDVADKHV